MTDSTSNQPTILRFAAAIGALAGALAVATGAFGAHALKASLTPQQLGWWQTAADYHLTHALALLALGLFARLAAPSAIARPGRLAGAAWLFIAGLVLFPGSLYAMALTDVRALGAVTPFGGSAFLIGWLLLAIALWPTPPKR
jgi:uncharacterized membrane protein YgdD (TMEM256/DUF423 family)